MDTNIIRQLYQNGVNIIGKDELIDSVQEDKINLVLTDLSETSAFSPGKTLRDSPQVTALYYQGKYVVICVNADFTQPDQAFDIDKFVEEFSVDDYVKVFGERLARQAFGREFAKTAFLKTAQKRVRQARASVQSQREVYTQKLESLREAEHVVFAIDSVFDTIPYEYEGGKFIKRFENIVCSNIRGPGRFFIEHITISIDFEAMTIRPVSGSCSYSGYANRQNHPHQMDNISFCLGTFGPDIAEAIATYNFDVLDVLMLKFVSTYDGDDTAGRHGSNFASQYPVPEQYA